MSSLILYAKGPSYRLVLVALAEHRIMSSEQLRGLVLRCGPARARRRLRLLFDNSLVRRLRFPAYPGVPPCLYILSKDGAAIVAERTHLAAVPKRPPKPPLVRHRYLVCESCVALREAVRALSSWRVLEWRHEEALRVPGEKGPPKGK